MDEEIKNNFDFGPNRDFVENEYPLERAKGIVEILSDIDLPESPLEEELKILRDELKSLLEQNPKNILELKRVIQNFDKAWKKHSFSVKKPESGKYERVNPPGKQS